MSQENLRAALIAAASMYPEGYGILRNLPAITSTQTTQLIFDRAEEIAAWLDAKEAGEVPTARATTAAAQQARRNDLISEAEMPGYLRWVDQNGLRDSDQSRRIWRAETGR